MVKIPAGMTYWVITLLHKIPIHFLKAISLKPDDLAGIF